MTEALRILRLQRPSDFEVHQNGIRLLLTRYRDILYTPATGMHPEALVENTHGLLPYLWVITGFHQGVQAVAGLSDIEPGRHAFIHGVSHPDMRRHPLLGKLAKVMFACAFRELKLPKLKAEFEAGNAGARGFCLRHGFVREAHFRRDVYVNGRWQDVIVASRFAEPAVREGNL